MGRKFDLRWQLLLAGVGIVLALAFLLSAQRTTQDQAETAPTPLAQVQASNNASTGSTDGLNCISQEPVRGGIFIEGILGAPQNINPLLSDGFPVDQELVSLIFDGLTQYNPQGELIPALAQSWETSADNLSIKFKLQDDIFWHDGQAITTADVAFTYGLMQSDSFPGNRQLMRLWQAVTIRPINEREIEFLLPEPYAPFLEATTRGILPAHLLKGATAVADAASGLPTHPFNQAPVGSGPFMMPEGQDWQRDGRLHLIPNPNYWTDGVLLDAIQLRFFPDEASLTNAFAAGEIHAINNLSPTTLPAVSQVEGVRFFTAVAPRMTSLLFNLFESDTTNSLELRQALAYAIDRNDLIDDVLIGQAVPLNGPYLPNSWAYHPELLDVYDNQPITATLKLEDAGWLLTDGQSVRQKVREENTKSLTVRLLIPSSVTHRTLANEIAARWQALGVEVELVVAADWAEFRQRLAERAFDVALVDISPPNDPDLYDFWSQEAILRGQNYSGWNHRRASEALEQARQITTAADRQPFYETFLRQFNADLPALTLYQHVYTYAVSGAVHGLEIGKITQSRDRFDTLAGWALNVEETAVACQ